MIGLWLFGCSPPTTIAHERPFQTGYAYYDTPVDRPPDPHTVAIVRRALAGSGLVFSDRDDTIASFFDLHVRSWRFWDQVYRVRYEYFYVLGELRRAGLPDVLAALPYQGSQFEAGLDATCAAGPWRLPMSTSGLAIGPCRLRGDPSPWSAGDPRPLVDEGACRVLNCDVDERNDLAASTTVAIAALKGTWEANGHDLRATLAAHARSAPEAVVAQHLAASCVIGTTLPGSFSAEAVVHCGEVEVPTLAEVDAVMRPR